MKVEVRCCCQPKKLLGWFDVPDREVVAGRERRFCVIGDLPLLGLVSGHYIIRLPIAEIQDYSAGDLRTWLAFKSEETPIEVLRKTVGFVENLSV